MYLMGKLKSDVVPPMVFFNDLFLYNHLYLSLFFRESFISDS